MLRFLARSPRSPSADSDGDRINGGNSILNGGGCRHRRAKRESRREQRQADKNGEGEAVSCSGPTCRRVRPGTTGSLPPPPHALHAPATRHTPPSLRHASSRPRLAGRGLSPLLQRVLMTLRSRPSGPPRVQPLAPPRQQRGSSTLRHGIRCERGINHGARRRRHSRTRFRCDGRSPHRGTRCHARAAHRTAPSLWARDFRSPSAHGGAQRRRSTTRRSFGGQKSVCFFLWWRDRAVVAGASAAVVGIAAHPGADVVFIIADKPIKRQRGNGARERSARRTRSRTSPDHAATGVMRTRLENECFGGGSRATGQGPPSE